MRKPRQRKCTVCSIKFQPERQMQPVCSIKCSIEKVKLDKAKQRRKADAKERERLKPRSQWLKEAQAIFNKYIRARDEGNPCISCRRFHTGQYHAGHFYTTSARPDLRFNEDNCHLQCQPCNTHKSGNINAYRENLLHKIGQERFEALEKVGRSDWDIDEIKTIKEEYKQKLKEWKKAEKFYNSLDNKIPF